AYILSLVLQRHLDNPHLLSLPTLRSSDLVSTSIIISLSIPFALYVTRTKSAISKVYRVLSLLPMVAPPFIFSLSLIILFGRRGVITEILNDIFGLRFSIYGFWGVVIAHVLSLFPVAFMMIETSLVSIVSSLEHDARVMCSTQRRVIFN